MLKWHTGLLKYNIQSKQLFMVVIFQILILWWWLGFSVVQHYLADMNFWHYHKSLGVKNDNTFWRNGLTFDFLSNQTANFPIIKKRFHVMHCFMLYKLISKKITLKLRGFYSNTSVEPPSGELICTCVCVSPLLKTSFIQMMHIAHLPRNPT